MSYLKAADINPARGSSDPCLYRGGVIRDCPNTLRYLYGDGIHLTVAHKREWSYGFKPDNKT
ncbi:hypothetical protein, partial [Aeromonas dhakensis]|uniref:hypothetical protein n=1 Tax=Aeromonas dhakensis TaxID=196024 RepID=UPI0038D1D19D